MQNDTVLLCVCDMLDCIVLTGRRNMLILSNNKYVIRLVKVLKGDLLNVKSMLNLFMSTIITADYAFYTSKQHKVVLKVCRHSK